MPLDELEQVRLDMRANGTVRLDHGAGVGVNIVPHSAHLCLQPATQRPEQIREAFAVKVWTFDALELWQQFVGQIGAPSVFAPTGVPPRSLDDDFVHVWFHDDLMVDVGICAEPGSGISMPTDKKRTGITCSTN
jgi:hypothetical protein